MIELHGKRVVVMGLGRFGGGVGAARYCATQGARVLVTDVLPEQQLAESMAQLGDVRVDYRLGGHEAADFAAADIVIVNPAVDPRRNPYLDTARKSGAKLISEIGLVISKLDRRRTIAVTGTAGKSTTVAMIGHILASTLGEKSVVIGGNIGGSLLNIVDSIRPDHWVVLELSSFMLEMLSTFSPHIAVVTNIADNHLDRHETMEAYAAAKQLIVRHQQVSDYAILGPSVADWKNHTPATVLEVDEPLNVHLAVPGAHNQMNAAMACAAATAAGVHHEEAAEAVVHFRGLPHRLQLIAEHNGVRFYNDSKSTTAPAAILAVDSFPARSTHIILGGYDKHSDLTGMARHAARFCAGIYTIGVTGPAIADAAVNTRSACPVHRCQTLEQAVRQAVAAAEPGQCVLLSPGCASWDQFENYEKRGSLFGELVLRYTDVE